MENQQEQMENLTPEQLAMSLMYQMQNGPESEQEQESEKTEESKRKLKKG
jgi:hypothetical protein